MKKIDFGQLLGVLANLAVVAGIVFLIIQIREERDYAIVENTTLIGFGLADWMSNVALDEGQASIMLRGSRKFEGLTPLEQYKFDLLMRSWIIRVEMGRIARARKVSPQGSGPGGESTMLTGNLVRFFDGEGTREWWRTADRRGLPKGAVAYIDNYLDQLAIAKLDTNEPIFSLELAVLEDGTASQSWTNGIAVVIGEAAAHEVAGEKTPLSREAEAWLQVLRDALPGIEARGRELARLFDVPPRDAIIVAGNRASSDGFGWLPNYIGINLQAFADIYGQPGAYALDRMVRIVAHEYLHLLSYAFYPEHYQLRDTPLDRALWTIFFEGIGDYVSMSSRWLPDNDGSYSDIAAARLEELEPVLVDRLEKISNASQEREEELRAGIAMGEFDKKWGSLPFALWLHSEVSQCGEADTLRATLRLERDSVFLLAVRHAAPELKTRIMKLQDRVSRMPDSVMDPNVKCIAS